MKVAVFGASGSTGSLVVKQLARRGHGAVAVSRSKRLFEPLPVNVEEKIGDLSDDKFVKEAIFDCDAVIFCVGLNRKTKSPWARQTSPIGLLNKITRSIVGAFSNDESQRLIYLSAFGVGEDYSKLSLLHRIVIQTSSLKKAYREHAQDEAFLKASKINWTIIKAPGLSDADRELPMADQGTSWSSFSMASRASVASFLVDCVEKPETNRKSMTIAEIKSPK